MKWTIGLGQFDIEMKARNQSEFLLTPLADLITEVVVPGLQNDISGRYTSMSQLETGLNLRNELRDDICGAVKCWFPVTNNIAEYEALIHGLTTAWELCSRKRCVFSDSQLVVNQFNGSVPSSYSPLSSGYYSDLVDDHVELSKDATEDFVPRQHCSSLGTGTTALRLDSSARDSDYGASAHNSYPDKCQTGRRTYRGKARGKA
ncbi:hypothetical protein M569_00013 [Genlisea aurea]|uniref:RNase H type-1 domain-containing protein n=1 Tax=Genlisea aurea TaxID=192259 RepID=S8EFB3_9LAMI|nr:hypothetical protein M569_00013 [Genlisea aurea]